MFNVSQQVMSYKSLTLTDNERSKYVRINGKTELYYKWYEDQCARGFQRMLDPSGIICWRKINQPNKIEHPLVAKLTDSSHTIRNRVITPTSDPTVFTAVSRSTPFSPLQEDQRQDHLPRQFVKNSFRKSNVITLTDLKQPQTDQKTSEKFTLFSGLGHTGRGPFDRIKGEIYHRKANSTSWLKQQPQPDQKTSDQSTLFSKLGSTAGGSSDKGRKMLESAMIHSKPTEDLTKKTNIEQCFNNAMKLYDDGNYKEALENFFTAIKEPLLLPKTSLAIAYFKLGCMHQQGREIKKDLDKAIEYYQEAAKLDDRKSIFNLGCAYATKKDINKALEYFETSATLEDQAQHQKTLNKLYKLGKTALDEQSLDEAKNYLQLANKLGDKKSSELLAELSKKSQPTEDEVWYDCVEPIVLGLYY